MKISIKLHTALKELDKFEKQGLDAQYVWDCVEDDLEKLCDTIATLESQHTQDGEIIADKIGEIAELGEKVRVLESDNEYLGIACDASYEAIQNSANRKKQLAKYEKDCDVCYGTGRYGSDGKDDCPNHCDNGKVRRWVVPDNVIKQIYGMAICNEELLDYIEDNFTQQPDGSWKIEQPS